MLRVISRTEEIDDLYRNKHDVLASFFLIIIISVFPDGAGKGQNSAQVHVNDEPRVTAGYF